MILRCNLPGCRLSVVEDCLQGPQIAISHDLVEPLFCSDEGRGQPANHHLTVLPVGDTAGLDAHSGIMMTHGQVPDPSSVDPKWKDKVLHARIALGETALFGADVPPERFQPMRSAYLSLSVDSIGEAERIYALLSKDGEIFMPMHETFFAHRFAMLRDRFGTSWMLINEKPVPRRD